MQHIDKMKYIPAQQRVLNEVKKMNDQSGPINHRREPKYVYE